MRNTCFWAPLVLRNAAKGRGEKERGKKRKERQERKELWYSQPPQTIPPLMCSESRRAARPSWFLNHFLQERLSTCSWAGFSQGWNAGRLSPSECLWLLSSFLELQPQRWKGLARRRWEAGWTCLFQGVDHLPLAPSHIIETHAPSLVRAGSQVKTQIWAIVFSSGRQTQIWIFHLLHLYSLADLDKADTFWAELDVKWILVIPPVTNIRVSWTASLGLPSCNFHLWRQGY